MPRSRNIKPGLYKNEHLVTLPFESRYMAAGLCCWADRSGRLEDRPMRLKMEMFPADNIDVNDLLNDLEKIGFIQRYTANNIKYIQIVKFEKHQHPHVNEVKSTIPAPEENQSSTPDSLLLVTSNIGQPDVDRFDEFWKAYPKKVKKKPAKGIWKRKKLNRLADVLVADIENRKQNDNRFNDFTPDPTTYLNQERWNDEITTPAPKELPKDLEKLIAHANKHGLPQARPGESLWDWRNRLEAAA